MIKIMFWIHDFICMVLPVVIVCAVIVYKTITCSHSAIVNARRDKNFKMLRLRLERLRQERMRRNDVEN